MKLTLIRTDRETGKESFSTLEAEPEHIKADRKVYHSAVAVCNLLFIYFSLNNPKNYFHQTHQMTLRFRPLYIH